MKKRRHRIARQILAVLTPQEIPEANTDPRQQVYAEDELGRKVFTTSDGVEYQVTFEEKHLPKFPSTWEISFWPSDGVTQSAKNYEVMQNVAAKVRDFLTEVNPRHIYMAPITNSRNRLFSGMIRKFLPHAQMVYQGKRGQSIYSLVPTQQTAPAVASRMAKEEPLHFFSSPNLTGFDGKWGREFDPDEPCVNCVIPTKGSDR